MDDKVINFESLSERYGQVYSVTTVLSADDAHEEEKVFYFKKPSALSFDRYIKGCSTSPLKASKTFALDNIVDDQEEILKELLEEYPAMTLGLVEKLFTLLGMSKDVSLKKL